MTIGQLLYAQETLVIEQCCNCHVYFAMPKEMVERKKEQGGSFYCPNGHGQHYTRTENEKLKGQIESLNRQISSKQTIIDEKNRQIDQLGYSIRAQKAAKTKILNRVKNGVCPCCNRFFKSLNLHFKSKHPELYE